MNRRLALNLRKGVKAWRRFSTKIIGPSQDGTETLIEYTCRTCGTAEVETQHISLAMAKRLETYWNDAAGTQGVCKACTKVERDERYPLTDK